MHTISPVSIIQPGCGSPTNFEGESRSLSSLGKHAQFVTPPNIDKPHAEALKLRFARQATARDLLPEWKVHDCLRVPFGNVIEVIHNPQYLRASYKNLMVCGSAKVCPVCGSKIGERRSAEIEQGATTWLDRQGGVLMATFTMQHQAGEPLELLVDALNEAYRRTRRGAPWERIEARYGLVGAITAREYTHGEHGWHPHLHALLFCRGGLKPKDIRELNRFLAARWGAMLLKEGRYSNPLYSVKVQASKDKALALYISKAGRSWTVGDELAKSNSKKARGKGRSIVQLLDAAPFERDAAHLFQEYAAATYRNASVVWTPGLRDLLRMEPEKTDEQVAQEDEKGGRLLVMFQHQQWSVILANDIRAEVLIKASAGDVEKVKAFVARFGIRLEDWQLEPLQEGAEHA